MKLYKYDSKTRELIGSKTAQKRPNGEYITDVLYATPVEPPVLKDNQQAVWGGESWDVVEDHRKRPGKEGSGTPYWLPGDGWDTPARYMTELGPPPEGALLEAPEKDLDTLRSDKLLEINGKYDAATSSIVSTYPSTELLTFDKQEQEARAYSDDHSASTPFLSGLANARGITLDDLVGRVIRKSEAFASAVATLTGQRQRYEDQLNAAMTAEEITAIVPEYKLPEA